MALVSTGRWRLAGMARVAWLAPILAAASCPSTDGPPSSAAAGDSSRAEPAATREARRALVGTLRAEGVSDERVLGAIGRVQRHRLVPAGLRPSAYDDRPLPIGHGQTISQPYVVAVMSELANLSPGDTVLEIGTGSGYQAAVLAELGARVFTIEIVPALAERARRDLDALGYGAVRTRVGDGYAGWPEEAPFDAILLTAAPPAVPEPLVAQLALGGRLVAPVGDLEQELVVITRTERGIRRERSLPVRFVPMTGRAQRGGAE